MRNLLENEGKTILRRLLDGRSDENLFLEFVIVVSYVDGEIERKHSIGEDIL